MIRTPKVFGFSKILALMDQDFINAFTFSSFKKVRKFSKDIVDIKIFKGMV